MNLRGWMRSLAAALVAIFATVGFVETHGLSGAAAPVHAKVALANTGQNLAPMGITAGILIVLGLGVAVGVAIKRRKRP